MRGPSELKVVKYVCADCDYVVSTKSGNSNDAVKRRKLYYCQFHTPGEMVLIPNYPYTPAWCPVLRSK